MEVRRDEVKSPKLHSSGRGYIQNELRRSNSKAHALKHLTTAFPLTGEPLPHRHRSRLEFKSSQLGKVRSRPILQSKGVKQRQAKPPLLLKEPREGVVRWRPEFLGLQPARPRFCSPLTLRVAQSAEDRHAGVTNEKRYSRAARQQRSQSVRRWRGRGGTSDRSR